ncbi:hypothetical protein BIW53_14515 [Pseudoalteromonas byunsanensis]|uniref:Uncharacterized protein n=1 Tax=Pseudoalteromonas byunsanensis TaxID=327939 RepID=A0A1S1MZD2_9GAMM|nr:hypothetical protein BIW53_14515 [Pseudoalteromonas byunsanensis]
MNYLNLLFYNNNDLSININFISKNDTFEQAPIGNPRFGDNENIYIFFDLKQKIRLKYQARNYRRKFFIALSAVNFTTINIEQYNHMILNDYI